MESRNPAGYELKKLYQPLNLAAQRVATRADMVASAGSDPRVFVVDNDEATGRQDVFYVWTGIEASEVPSNGALAEQVTIAATSATTATTKAGEAAGSATAAVNAKTAAEAARDIAVANTVERIYVDTYAEAEPYFTGPMPREVYVAADEAYYEGDPSWYKYDPQLGTALLGIDFNYTEE